MFAASDLAIKGSDLSVKQALALERKVPLSPDSFDIRVMLLGFYLRRYIRSASIQRKRTAHIFWMIRNYPHNAFTGTPWCQINVGIQKSAFNKAKKEWLCQVGKRSRDVAVLRNASHFFTLDNSKLAHRYLKRLQKLEPTNPEWKDRLSHLFKLEINHSNSKRRNQNLAVKALQQKEEAYRLTRDKKSRFYLLDGLSTLAFLADRHRKAANYARLSLKAAVKFKKNWHYANAIHAAHTTLGLIALQNGKREEAKEHLLTSTTRKGSPQLNSFGPKMDLAKALLAVGEGEVVITYLRQCAVYWHGNEKWINGWIREIETTDISSLQKKY